jgi:hypothetical protein
MTSFLRKKVLEMTLRKGKAGKELLYAVDLDHFPWGGILRSVFKVEILPVY